jgi:hypothetical protein
MLVINGVKERMADAEVIDSYKRDHLCTIDPHAQSAIISRDRRQENG